LQKIAALLARFPGAELIDETHVRMPNGKVRSLQADAKGEPALGEEWTVAASKAFLDQAAAGGSGGDGSGGGSGGGASASDDPRYWDIQYQKLYQDALNMGLDSETARRQALASLIQNRNNTAVDTANISNDVAKTAAQFAANPRDAFAELFYRNQTGGSTPFGDMTNDNFGAYGKALADKAESIFSPVNQDLNQLRTYRDAIPPTEFFGSETRNQLGLPPTTAQSLLGSTAGGPAAVTAPVNGLQALMDQLNGMNRSPTSASGRPRPHRQRWQRAARWTSRVSSRTVTSLDSRRHLRKVALH
jgi:hypothetical protein